MTFTYIDPALNTRDAVRCEIQDINPNAPLLEDAEIDFAIEQETNSESPTSNEVLSAAARCMEILSRRFAALADRQAGTLKLTSTKRATIYAQRAAELRERTQEYHAPYAGGINRAEKRAQAQNPNRQGSIFRLKQFQNPLGRRW